MNMEQFNKDKEIVSKVVNRIKASANLHVNNSTWTFDDLVIERYNCLYKISFKGIVLGHYHANDKVCPEYNQFYDDIYYSIENKKKSLLESALSEL